MSIMGKMDWKEATRTLKKAISLPASPIGIKLLREAKSLLDYPSVRMLTATALCQMTSMARYAREEGIVGASSEAQKCVWGASCLGLIETPDRLSEGDLNRPFTEDQEAAVRLHESMTMLGNKGKQFSAMIVAPLDLMPVEPEAVILYLTPAQALRLIIAFAYRKGEPITATMTGQASVCSSIALAVGEGKTTIDIPCMGDRTYGLVQEHELVMVFPASRMSELLEGLACTEPIAPYPYTPFLRWPVIFPPQFEPRGNEFKETPADNP